MAVGHSPREPLPDSRRHRLRQLKEHLSDEDRALLALRVDQELEWEEIVAVLSAESGAVTAAALRKRYERMKARIEALARELRLLE